MLITCRVPPDISCRLSITWHANLFHFINNMAAWHFSCRTDYVSRHFRAACAVLGIQVILGRRKNPAPRGKVERFNQTAQNEVYPELRLLVAREEVKTVEEANAYFWAWLEEDYHRRPHSETGEPPRDRYFRKPPLPPDPMALANLFLTRDTRTVSKDATIRIGSNHFTRWTPNSGTSRRSRCATTPSTSRGWRYGLTAASTRWRSL